MLKIIVQHIRIVIVFLIGIMLVGCGSLFESDNQAPPAELTDYEHTITINELWSKSLGDGNDGQPLRLIPTYSQERIFIADHEGTVHSVEAKNGEILWQVELDAPIASGPGLGGDKVFLGTNKAEVIALGMVDGKELWRSQVSSEVIAVPKANDTIVVVRTIDGHLYGINSTDGVHKWLYDRTEPALTLRGNSSPVIDGDAVIAGLSNGILVNLALANGEPRWETAVSQPTGRSELERIADIDADPLIRDDLVYVASYQGEIASVDRNTGVPLWHRKLSMYNDLTTDGERLYVTDVTSRVLALDLQTGAILWQQDQLLNRRLSAPAILSNHIIVGDFDGYVHVLSPTDGTQKARTRVGSAALTTTPLVVDAVAYLYADNGRLTALTIGQAPATTK